MTPSLIDNHIDSWATVKSSSSNDGDYFTGDDVIDAYFNGRQDQLHEDKKTMFKGFLSTLTAAMNEGADFAEYLDSLEIQYEKALLKVKGYNRFNVMFLIDEDVWMSPEFNQVYNKSIEKEKMDRDYDLSLIFMPISDNFYDSDMLSSDGYFLSYEPKEV